MHVNINEKQGYYTQFYSQPLYETLVGFGEVMIKFMTSNEYSCTYS